MKQFAPLYKSLLFRKYVRILVVCMAGLTGSVGLVHLLLVADAQKKSVVRVLDAETRTASEHIQGFFDNSVASLKWIDDLDEPGTTPDYGALHDAGYRLLRRTSSVLNLSYLDAAGCERVFISRLLPDAREECHGDAAQSPLATMFSRTRAAGVAYGEVFFPDGSEPHMYIGIASRGKNTGALVAELNLKVIHDSVAAIHVGASGIGFVVDETGRLIAHPDESLVLRQSRLTASEAAFSPREGLNIATNVSGKPVVIASQRIIGPPWRVLVEQPVSEALVPVYSALWSTGALVLAAVVSSLIAGLIVAERLVRPLSQLRDGASRIAAGDLATQLIVTSKDEIGQVANGFNQMARSLADANAYLEAKVADRTAALRDTTRQVQQQAQELSTLNQALEVSLEDARLRKEDAERANAAKTRFLAVASHDLRQPMHAVSLLVGLLSERIQYPEVRRIVQKVQSSVDSMAELFNALLDISKLDSGVVLPVIEEFPVENLLERVRTSYEPLAEEKGLQCSVDFDSSLVRSDAALLERILSNLVSNAIRYTLRGYVRVRCESSRELLTISVEDTGIGIAAEYHQRIFDEFFQISQSTSTRGTGLGLGLSIVKRSADLLGIKISMRSDACGSRFQVDVPRVGAFDPSPAGRLGAREVGQRLATAFVVVIDDDADSRFATEATYRHWGCQVLVGESTRQVVQELASHLRLPDLLVTDLHLQPGSSGSSAINAVRAYAESPIPAIVVTGESTGLELFDLPSGCVVLQKPVGSARLREVSEQLLRVEVIGDSG